ncbi:Ankyrin repeat and KH domain-containing protein mask [Atta colombica]|uniref:Ankyrin repeat and KH domain-containing protein mask n=1 Tax=Atta colombica TaxID=520822 RepID=A0A195BPS3_9HYME|nr:Ankyrin repeat and KH domain-containing protein mask [Atta colombica]
MLNLPSCNTPLIYGRADGHKEVRVSLDSGADVEDHNEIGYTPLMNTASTGHIHIVKVLLEYKNSINTRSNIFEKNIILLLETGTDQEHKFHEMHIVLIEAKINSHMKVVFFLDSVAQITMINTSEMPLTFAASKNLVDLAQFERRTNIEEVIDDGYTPLMQAAFENNEEMIALLLSEGADINAYNKGTKETIFVLRK